MNNVVDFSFEGYRKNFLFLKKPYQSELPEGWQWKCGCGTLNILNPKEIEMWCPKCGTRLRIQTQKEEDGQGNVPNGTSFTLVRVAHFTVRSNVQGT